MIANTNGYRPSGNPNKTAVGVGMPTNILLHQFGYVLFQAFGEVAYHVGSSLTSTTWRDVDVRIMLDDDKYASMGFGDPNQPMTNGRWRAYVQAFSALGRQMTGLPIDFQIQSTTWANEQYDGQRSALVFAIPRTEE